MYETVDQVYDKVEWEGGLFETAFVYGLSSEAFADEGDPKFTELKSAWVEMEKAYSHFKPFYNRVHSMLYDGEEN